MGILQAMNNAATEYEIVVGTVQGGRGTTRYFPYVQLKKLDFIAEMLGDQIATWRAQCRKKKWTGVEITLVDDIYPILGIDQEDEDNEDKPKTILRKADEKGEPAAEKNDEPESTDQDNISSEDSDDGGDVLDVG